MTFTPMLAMVRKDLLIFFGDRRAVIVAFIVPIAIASFFGSLFGGSGGGGTAISKLPVAIVDQDASTISRAFVASASGDPYLAVSSPTETEARDLVRKGKLSVGVLIPQGFGDASGRALFGAGAKPQVVYLYDPSRRMEMAMVRGILTEHAMQAVTGEMFGGAQGRALIDSTLPQIKAQAGTQQDAALVQMLEGVQRYYNRPVAPAGAPGRTQSLAMPYDVKEEAMTSSDNAAYNGYAHSFAGMGMQFLLFTMANMGIDMLLERQRGLWKRLRSAPVGRLTLLGGKVLSGTIISMLTLWVAFAFAMIVFHVRINGSVAGFAGVSVASCLLAATFGLLVAALGNTPATARGVTTLAVLMMVMLGGGWVPAFVFPQWMQQATKVVPIRWAIDGFDAMTWRGIGFSGADAPILVLLGFSALFAAVAAARFKWEEA